MAPRVTVITPTYNRAGFLPETLESIAAQGWPNLEHIVVDDGSTDDTPAVVGALASRMPHVRYVRKTNGGEASATNLGWYLASGDYVVVVCSDDPQPPELLGESVEHLERHPEAIVSYPDWWMIDGDGRRTQKVEVPEFSLERLVGDCHCFVGPGAFIRRRAVVHAAQELRDPAFRYVSDYSCWLALCRLGPFTRLPKPVAAWRQHLGQETYAGRGRPFASEHVRLLYKFFARTDLPPEVRALERRAKQRVWALAAAIARGHDLPAFLASSAAALALGPPEGRMRSLRAKAARLYARTGHR